METQWLPASLFVWITALAGTLDARQQARFVQLGGGLLFARGRRTVASWLRACAAGRDYQRDYSRLGSVGRKATALAGKVLRILTDRLPPERPGAPLVFAWDDSPTKRYGPHVEGAGTHHNPTPGPAGSKFLYGHVWVGLARLVRHPRFGAIALPILSHLYIRAKDVGWMAADYGWEFPTKLELAAALVEWLVPRLGKDHPPLWVVTDGADAKRPFLKRVRAAGVTVMLEQVFHDVKEVHGAGQQPLRHVWANVGAWNRIGWWPTLVELWAWNRSQARLCDRSDSPWDQKERRPSHANRCQELRREALQEEYSHLPAVAAVHPKIRRFIQRLMRRVA